MSKTVSVLTLTLPALFALSLSTQAQDGPNSDESHRIRESIAVLNEVMTTSDTSIPASIASKAEAIAVFPGTLKGGFIVGGMRGRGILSARTEGGWSVPTFMTLTGGSIGLQIGGQAADLVLIIMNRRGLEQFVRNQFKFGADAAVAAGPVGRDAQATTDLQLRAEILSYSRARGLFAGVTVNGSTVRADLDANQRFYGKRLTVRNSCSTTPPSSLPRRSRNGSRRSASTSSADRRYFFRRSAIRPASVFNTLIRAKFLSLPSTSVQGAIFVLVRATMSFTASGVVRPSLPVPPVFVGDLPLLVAGAARDRESAGAARPC